MSEQKAEAQPILELKEKLTEPLPTPPELTSTSSAQALDDRLKWGEPALTILDARDREAFLTERITGAMLMSDLKNIEDIRDIYVYGNNEEESATAAEELRQSGFKNVAQLKGGLAGWKAIGGATEGRAA